MGSVIKVIFLFALIAIHLPSTAGHRNPRYLNYYYKYGSYYRYTYVYTVPSDNNGTACGSTCVAGSVFTTLATQPCLICCVIVVAYFLCKCSCAACDGACKSSSRNRGRNDDSPVTERTSRPHCHRRFGCTNDVMMMSMAEDTPPPYSPDMQKCQPEKILEEKPPGYEDIYQGEPYPAQQ